MAVYHGKRHNPEINRLSAGLTGYASRKDKEVSKTMKETIVGILVEELSYIYCHTCKFDGGNCDECHRRAMGWGLSDTAADEIADKIIAGLKA